MLLNYMIVYMIIYMNNYNAMQSGCVICYVGVGKLPEYVSKIVNDDQFFFFVKTIFSLLFLIALMIIWLLLTRPLISLE